jgi:hypothetical protein
MPMNRKSHLVLLKSQIKIPLRVFHWLLSLVRVITNDGLARIMEISSLAMIK